MFEKYKKVYKADYEKWYKENEAYRQRVAADQDRLKFHLMPKTGWLNDPNGLCQFNGTYHIYYQYTPFEPTGELKTWGHYTTKDFIHYEDFGPVVFPDEDIDAHGVYSGSAFIEDDTIHYFYTGNLKYFDRDDYDYINSGRGSNTITFTSKDGYEFTKKELLMTTDDYPADMSNHVRDPKIFKKNEKYYMVLGARDVEGVGMILLYESTDLKNWTYKNRITTPQKFGYMWECPDLFEIDGEQALSISPQGLEREEYRFQNIYQSGYFLLKEDKINVKEFQEWDMGFDFYAPQTFEDAKGRRILIGWMGLPDVEEEYTNPTAKDEGWQHCLTIPREITLHDGRLYQYPVEEMEALRGRCCEIDETQKNIEVWKPFELDLKLDSRKCRISVGDDLMFEADGREACLRLSEKAGAGRKQRKAVIPSGRLKELRMLVDTTAVEIYLNHGEVVSSTRYYPGKTTQVVKLEADKIQGHIYELKEMTGIK